MVRSLTIFLALIYLIKTILIIYCTKGVSKIKLAKNASIYLLVQHGTNKATILKQQKA